MKHTKRILSLILVLVMVFALCAPALADRSYEPYKYYMCVGDSIAAGCALTKDGSETYFDQNTDDYTTVYNNDYIYIGYDYLPVPTAYHSIVANALDAKLLQYARSGLRAVEFRYFLEGVYNDYDTTRSWGNTYFDTDGNGTFTLSDLDAIDAMVNYKEAIKKTDVISVNVGSNDVFTFTLGVVLEEMTGDSDNAALKAIKEFLNNGGSLGAAFGKLIEYCQSALLMPKLAATITSTFAKAYDQFEENYDVVMERIHELNPDITVIAVGVYNPFKHFRLSDGSILDLSGLAAPIVNRINLHLKTLSYKYDNFYYADVVGTETYDMNYNDRYFWEYFSLKVHPTLAGHEFMAQQILGTLPERGTLPFTDVPADAWYYDEHYYAWFNGLIKGTGDTTFEPDATTTRAQAVTVLYRIAGSPNVSGLTEPFTDVSDNHWAHDAIVWAYENAIVKGYDATTFGPDDGLTRGQFVAIMHRYAGSPQVSGDLGVFSDCADIPFEFRNSVRWAVANGIVNGYADGTFRPSTVISRAQLAAILARFDRL